MATGVPDHAQAYSFEQEPAVAARDSTPVVRHGADRAGDLVAGQTPLVGRTGLSSLHQHGGSFLPDGGQACAVGLIQLNLPSRNRLSPAHGVALQKFGGVCGREVAHFNTCLVCALFGLG